MEGLDLGQTSNPSLAWKSDVFKINDDDDDDEGFTRRGNSDAKSAKIVSHHKYRLSYSVKMP